MGYFSFTYADTNNKEKLRIGGKAYIPLPSGNFLYEPNYNGYGSFNGKDIHYMFAMWNKKYLSADLVDELYEPPKRETYTNIPWVDDVAKEEEYYNAALKRYERDKAVFVYFLESDSVSFENIRNIGIELFFSENEKVKNSIKYPIRIMKNESSCDNPSLYPASEDDPDQGCF